MMVNIPYSPERVATIKTIAGRWGHRHEQDWSVPQAPDALTQRLTLFDGKPVEVDPSLDAVPASQQEQPFPESPSAMVDRLCAALRARHYARRTEQADGHWVTRFTHFHHGRHRAEMAEPEMNAFLTHLALREKVSASTQNQALSALLFLYRHVIGRAVGNLGEVICARKPTRLPVVMTREEVKTVLTNLTGDKWLMASIMYGAGLRLMECLRLRMQDIDFSRNEMLIRDGKGAKDR